MAASLAVAVDQEWPGTGPESHALAHPSDASNIQNFAWTLASQFGDALRFAEARYGARDLNWTLLGVELASLPAPQIFYTGAYQGRRDIIVQLTAEAATDKKRALFQLGHEVIHILSPIGHQCSASVLEEGIATYNSLEYVRESGIEIGAGYIGSAQYESAYCSILELEAAHPEFMARTARLRRDAAGLSALNLFQVRKAYPKISTALAHRLASKF